MVSKSFDELVRTGYNDFKNITGIYEKRNGEYVGRTFGEFYGDVRSLAQKMLDMGLYGKRVMLYGKNSYNWLVAFLAIAAYVGVAVPIDKDWKNNDINNVLSDIDIDFIFFSCDKAENLTNAKCLKANFENDTTDLIVQGRELDIKFQPQNPERVCSVFFTSGTTSAPRKIELTEKNCFANSQALSELFSITPDDRYMLSLPLSHVGTVFANFRYPIEMGASLFIPDDFKEMSEDLKLIRPTVIYGVPRVFEKLWENISADKRINRVIKFSNFLRKFGIDLRKKVFSKLHDDLGGTVRFAYNGAAKLDDTLIHTFDDMGILILQAYGMTESSAIIACDSEMNYKLGSVGKVLSNQICSIINQDENGVGEICVKGDNIAVCAISDDGYLHTGDFGYIDEEGYLFFVRRSKRLIKLSNGKNIYPDELEELLTQNKGIIRTRVYDKGGCVSADIVSDFGHEVVYGLVEKLNKNLPYYMQIQRVEVIKAHEK